jgi:hypothetical protein
VKKILIPALLLAVLLTACDALGLGEEPTPVPPSEASVSEVGYLSKVIFDLPNAAGGDYRVVVAGVEFSCRTYEDYPDQLFCFGPELPAGDHEAQIFAGDQETPLFSLTVTVTSYEVVITATPPAETPTPAPTDTPLPTPTATLEATREVTGTQTITPTPAQPTSGAAVSPTLSPDEAIKVFYFNIEESGRYGCGEAMYWVKSNQPITSNTANNITYGLRMLFNYHQPYFGELYNAYGASDNQFAVGHIEFVENGVNVFLTGTYENSGDPCDAARLKDQIYRIVTQFPDVTRAWVYLNGTILEDALQRK